MNFFKSSLSITENFSCQTSLLMVLLTIIILIVGLYIILYTKLVLKRSISSFFFFTINIIIIIFFILGFYNILFNLKEPIYVKDISEYTIYRYSIFLFAGMFFIFIYIINTFIFKINKQKFTWCQYPYLKEEIRKIIKELPIFDKLFKHLTTFLEKTNNNIYFYFGINFIFIYLISIIQTIFLINFTLYQGDLRYNIYLLPLSFLSWILKNIEYCFKIVLEDNFSYCRELLHIVRKNNKIVEKSIKIGANIFIEINEIDFDFILTPFGHTEGYTKQRDLTALRSIWIDYANISYFFTLYEQNFIYYIKLVLLFLRSICWIILISYYFFNEISSIYLGFFSTISSSMNRVMPKQLNIRSYVSAAFSIKQKAQERLEKETEDIYHRGHLVKVDSTITDEKGRILFEGCVTHGKGSNNNPSYKESSTHDFSGPNPRGQSTIPPGRRTFISKYYLYKKIPNSENLYETSESRLNTAKNTYKNWEEDNT